MDIFKRSEKANPRFTELHLMIALKVIAEDGAIGRKRLTEILRLGEGSVRTILNKLKGESLISSSQVGHVISEKGRKFLERNFPKGTKIAAAELTLSKENYAVLVEGASNKIVSGLEQRDEAIKVGADCAVTLVYEGRRLRFPKRVDLKGRYGKAIEEITSKFDLKEGDVIIIGGGSNIVKAIEGALAASKAIGN